MPKKLAKRTRTLLISAIALVAVIGLLVALLLLLPEPTSDTPDTPATDTTITLLHKKDKVSLTEAVVSVGKRSHTVLLTKEDLYTVKGFEDLPLDQGLLVEFAEELKSVTATRLVVDAPENPAEFGFDTDTTLSVTAAFSDDSTYAFELGNPDPSGEGCYLREVGKSTVYIADISFCETVSQDKNDFLSIYPITAPESDDPADTVAVRDVLLNGTVRPQPIYYEVAEAPKDNSETLIITGYVVKKPHYHTVDKDTSSLAPATFSNLAASGIEKVRPTTAQLAGYGLTNPYSACTVNLAMKHVETKMVDNKEQEITTYHTVFNYTIRLGKTNDNGEYYGVVYAEGKLIPIVYLFPKSTVPWVEDQYEDVADDMLFFQYIQNVNSFSLTADGKTTAFTLSHHPDAEENNDKLTVKSGNKVYDTASFRKLYASLMGLYRQEGYDGKPNGALLLTIKYTPSKQYGDPVHVDIYEHTAGSCVAIHRTGERHLINARDIHDFLSRYQKFLNGEILE